MMSESKQPPTKPLESFSVGGLSVSLWENRTDGSEGNDRTFRSVTLRKAYYNRKESQLASQSLSIGPAEVACLIGLLKKMEEAVIQRGGPSHVTS
jgi:hypothetical protein